MSRAPAIEGYSRRYNPLKDCVVIRVHYRADPAKRDPRWIAGVKKRSPSHHAYLREYELDWSSPAGNPFYDTFAADPAKYVHPLKQLISAPVYRAWDFGYRHPAVVFFQVSQSKRLWVIRECMPAGIDSHSFRDLILYLSGQVEYDALVRRPRALEWLAELGRMRKVDETWRAIPEPPWFGQSTQFVDVSGPEATKISATVATESKEKSDAEILASGGINLQMTWQRIEDGENIIRRLLLDAPDGLPGMLIDPACPLLIGGMKGGIAFPKPTKAVPIPVKPHKDGFFENLHDCLRYGVVASVPVTEDGEIARPQTVVLGDRRIVQVYPGQAGKEVGFYENEKDLWK
jgi:hypothetical protein